MADTGLTLGIPRVPTPQWLLGMIVAIGPEWVEKACQRLLYKAVRIAIKSGLMPARRILAAAPQNGGIAKAVDRRMRNRLRKVSWYVMQSDNGNGFAFNLVIFKKMVVEKGRGWKYMTFASNMLRAVLLRELDELLDTYSKRWIIENNYKSIESCRARTCSRNRSVQPFLFYMSLIEYSLRYLASWS